MLSAKLFQKISTVFLAIYITSCAAKPYPYYDSAGIDKNRAPSSITKSIEKSVASEGSQSKVDYLFLSAEMFALEGDSSLAIDKLKEAYELDPQSVLIMHRIATEYYRQNKNEESLVWAEKALKAQPNQKDVNILAAGLYTSQKNFGKAEAIYKKLIKLDKNDPEAYLYYAAVNSEQKKYNEAIKYFTKLTRFEDYSQKHLAYYYNARTKFEANRVKYFQEIKSDLKNALLEKPDYLEALQFLGQIVEKTEGKKKVFELYAQHQKKYGPIGRLAEVLSQYYLELGDYDKAYEQLEIVENSSADPIQVKLKLALILIDKKIYDKAIVRLEELSSLVPESDKVKFYLASLYQEAKKYDLAVKNYLAIQPSSKHYEDSIKNAAFLMKEIGQYSQATNVLAKLVKDFPENIQNHIAYAQLLEDGRKYSEGIDVLKGAFQKFPLDANVPYFLGTLYDKLNDKENMFKYMNKSLNLDANHVQTLNYLAYSLLEAQKDLDKAEQYALKAHNLDSNDPYIIDTVGWLYYQKGDYQKALAFLEKAHQFVPDVAVIADHLGDVYVKLNQFNKAYELYKKAKDNEIDLDKIKQISLKLSNVSLKIDALRLPASFTSSEPNFLKDSDLSKDGSK